MFEHQQNRHFRIPKHRNVFFEIVFRNTCPSKMLFRNDVDWKHENRLETIQVILETKSVISKQSFGIGNMICRWEIKIQLYVSN